MTTWFTADQHFGHARLLELSAARGAAFPTVAEMDARLVHNWNSVVQPDDTVWVLGDFDMHGKDASLTLVEQLNGTKILVSGNHDSCWAGVREGWKNRELYQSAGFVAVMDFAVTTLPPLRPQAPATRVLMSHFPYAGDSQDEDRYAQFRLRDEGIPLLHGHVHESFRERRTKKGTWHINVGVDWWDYAPVSADTLAQHLEDLRRGRVEPVDGS
ncbi:MAG: metallophosphoesterase family protein [Nocardioides sp.]|uniref:metallophosphoesterase family protein n=1 Tax=Nocardioides sp. TaxID=35761 RepID=UPI0039E3F351